MSKTKPARKSTAKPAAPKLPTRTTDHAPQAPAVPMH